MRRSGRFRIVAAGVLLGLGGVWAAGQAPAPAPAGGKRPMTFADLMAMKRVSDPQISPSGRWVLFSVTNVDLAKNTKTNHLWVVPLDGSGAKEADSSAALRNDKQGGNGVAGGNADADASGERQVTFGTGESFGRFAPNGQFVSYTGAPTKDDPYARITIATWDDATGTIGVGRTLTAVSGDADGAVWSPDSKRLMFTAEVYPECSVKGGGELQGQKQIPFGNDNQKDIEVGGTRDLAAWRGMQPAGWAEEDACDKAKDEAADKNPVKAQVWDGLLYRHWDHWTGAQRTHILLAELTGRPVSRAFSEEQLSADSLKRPAGGDAAGALDWQIRDVTTARDVGDAETPTWMLGGPQEYAWAPDSKEIAYVTDLSAVPAASTNNDVFTLRLDEPGAKAVKVSTSPGSDDEPEYSPDGKYLAFRSQRQARFESDRFRLMLYDREKETARELMPKFDDWVDEFVWASDSDRVYFASGYLGEEPVFFTSLSDPKVNKIEDPYLRGEFGDLRVSSDGRTLVASRMSIDRPSAIYAFGTDRQTGWTEDPVTPKTMANLPLNHVDLSIGWYPVKSILLSRANEPLLSSLALDSLDSFFFAGAGGTHVHGFLLRPPNFDPKKKYPVKFLMHGGPQTAEGDSWSYRWNFELMAASGYVVVGINRRGSTGYGQKFVDEVSGDWGGRAYEDLMKGLDYAETHYAFIDKTRECALGASYGGYMADWVLTHTNRFKCIVTHDGLYDAAAAYGTTEEMWFPEWEFRRPEDFPKGWDGFSAGYDPMGHINPTHDDKAVVNGPPGARGREADSSAALRNDKQETTTGVLRSAQDDGSLGGGHAAEPWRYAGLPASEDPFRKWSPMQFIQNAKTPTLVIHSQRDYRLDISQDFALYTALQRLGVPSRFLYFPDEGHWVLKPRNSELWYQTVGDWCDRWTKTGKYAEK